MLEKSLTELVKMAYLLEFPTKPFGGTTCRSCRKSSADGLAKAVATVRSPRDGGVG
jgi:hypothetical protein